MPRLEFEHSTGAHCGSTSLRNLSTYYDWGFDEPACFGLGEGLGFSYLQLPDSPHRAIFGRTGWLERAFFENLQIPHTIHEGQDFADAWADITARIDKGDPVMIFTDLYYLDYYDSDTHFAPHSLLVVGSEETADGEYVLLADSEFAEIQRLPVDRLKQALTSEHVVPLQCRYLNVDEPTLGRDFPAAARDAIRETATYMLDPSASERHSKYFSSQGVGEIEAFGADLPAWTELPDPAWSVRFAYQNIERRGTGGGAFRRLFADFLAQATDVVDIPADAPERTTEIADQWTVLSERLSEASEAKDEASMGSILEAAADDVREIAAAERRLYEDLRTALAE